MAAETAVYVLDRFGLLAYFKDEPGGHRVKAVLAQAARQRAEVYASVVNYGEVVYIAEREHGVRAAQKLIAAIDQLPMTVVDAEGITQNCWAGWHPAWLARDGLPNPSLQMPDLAIRLERPKSHQHFCVILRERPMPRTAPDTRRPLGYGNG